MWGWSREQLVEEAYGLNRYGEPGDGYLCLGTDWSPTGWHIRPTGLVSEPIVAIPLDYGTPGDHLEWTCPICGRWNVEDTDEPGVPGDLVVCEGRHELAYFSPYFEEEAKTEQ